MAETSSSITARQRILLIQYESDITARTKLDASETREISRLRAILAQYPPHLSTEKLEKCREVAKEAKEAAEAKATAIYHNDVAHAGLERAKGLGRVDAKRTNLLTREEDVEEVHSSELALSDVKKIETEMAEKEVIDTEEEMVKSIYMHALADAELRKSVQLFNFGEDYVRQLLKHRFGRPDNGSRGDFDAEGAHEAVAAKISIHIKQLKVREMEVLSIKAKAKMEWQMLLNEAMKDNIAICQVNDFDEIMKDKTPLLRFQDQLFISNPKPASLENNTIDRQSLKPLAAEPDFRISKKRTSSPHVDTNAVVGAGTSNENTSKKARHNYHSEDKKLKVIMDLTDGQLSYGDDKFESCKIGTYKVFKCTKEPLKFKSRTGTKWKIVSYIVNRKKIASRSGSEWISLDADKQYTIRTEGPFTSLYTIPTAIDDVYIYELVAEKIHKTEASNNVIPSPKVGIPAVATKDTTPDQHQTPYNSKDELKASLGEHRLSDLFSSV